MSNFHGDFTRTELGIHGNDFGGLFLSVDITVFFPIPRTRVVSRMPLPLKAMLTI